LKNVAASQGSGKLKMVTVLFFGQLRERVGTQSIQIDIGDNGTQTVEAIKGSLVEQSSAFQCLTEDDTLCAVNEVIVPCDTTCINGDTVAFFPPVTGG